MRFSCTADWAPGKELDIEAETPQEAAESFADIYYDPDDHDSEGDEYLDVDVVDENGETTYVNVEIIRDYSFKAGEDEEDEDWD